MTYQIESIPGVTQTCVYFVGIVRAFLRDSAELNRLTAGQESNNRQILWAVADALSDFNGTPPFTNYSLEDLIAQNQTHLLTRMAVISLLQSIGMLQTRNHINYSAGGITVGVNDKSPLIIQWLQLFEATVEQKKLRAKVAMNINQILGPGNHGVASEYWRVNSSYTLY